jgi:hypothetical protein
MRTRLVATRISLRPAGTDYFSEFRHSCHKNFRHLRTGNHPCLALAQVLTRQPRRAPGIWDVADRPLRTAAHTHVLGRNYII